MGWTCLYTRDPEAEIRSLFRSDTAEIVKLSKVGSTYYVACRTTMNLHDYEPDPETGSVTFAAVILTSHRNGEFCYKDMDETMGPNASQAPLALLKLLSPTTAPYALAWRERCRTYARRPRPKLGDVVRLHTPWEPYGDLFEKVPYHRKSVYKSLKTNQLVRLRGSDIKEVVTPNP